MQNFLLENHRESNCRSKCGKVRKFSVFLLDVPSELQFQAKKYPGALAAQPFYGQAIQHRNADFETCSNFFFDFADKKPLYPSNFNGWIHYVLDQIHEKAQFPGLPKLILDKS